MAKKGRKKREYTQINGYMKRRYEPITTEYLAQMDAKHKGAVSFYTNVILDFIENLYNGFGLPVHQKRFANRRANFIHFGINLTQYLDYLHEHKRLVQVLIPSGSLLYFPAKVLDTMNQEELLGAALEAEEIMRAKQREAIQAAANERAERAHMRRMVQFGGSKIVERAIRKATITEAVEQEAPIADVSAEPKPADS